MEQAAALSERIRLLKSIAASLSEGAFHTRLIPEIDKILALPDELTASSIGEREAISRQVREYEQTFDRLGYTLLEQLMPPTEVSSVFQVVQAAEEFKTRLRAKVGQPLSLQHPGQTLTAHEAEELTRYSLSIGTPPVTGPVRGLIGRIVFGRPDSQLDRYLDILPANRADLQQLFDLCKALIGSSLHYNTGAEELAFLQEATDYPHFEGGRILNRVVITESPDRVIDLIQNHVFDKVSPNGPAAVQVVDGVDRLNDALIARMHAAPNQVFVARITRLPHWQFMPANGGETPWRSVLGRLILIDASERARQSNTTIVHTLFPHVARTLRNIQTSLAGRPANTQLQLRRMLESLPPSSLSDIHSAIEARLRMLESEGAHQVTVPELRRLDWRRGALADYATLMKLRRFVRFVESIATSSDEQRKALGQQLRSQVAADWMKYFYEGLPPESYPITVVPGGGRGALTLVGEAHCQSVRQLACQFIEQKLSECLVQLQSLKNQLQIPSSSTDEIEAAMKQSQLRALPSAQTVSTTPSPRYHQHLATTLLYRAADAASRVTRQTQSSLDRATFGNLTGGAAALFKRTMSRAGFGALHGRLEKVLGQPLQQYDKSIRTRLLPIQDVLRNVRRATDQLKGELDPIAVSEIEAILTTIKQDGFYPILILPELSWTYQDVFPEKDFPRRWTWRIALNDHHELDPLALLKNLEALRYLLRGFPEVFELYCRSMVLVINSPHNPTGVVYRQETILRLLQLASEFELTVVDDNAYHKLVSSERKAREGEACVAQIYEQHRSYFSRPVRIITVGATTKALQGSGDRTGIVHANDPEIVSYIEQRASEPHLMSLYLTQLKLESGLAVKRCTSELESIAAQMLDLSWNPPPWRRLEDLLAEQLKALGQEDFSLCLFETILDGYEELLKLNQRSANRADLARYLSELVRRTKRLRPERMLRDDVERRFAQARAARQKALPNAQDIVPEGAFYYCVQLCRADDDRGVQEFLRALSRYRKIDLTYAGQGYVRLSLGGTVQGDKRSYERLGRAIEIYLRLVKRYWDQYDQQGRNPARLVDLLAPKETPFWELVLEDLKDLIALHPAKERTVQGQPLAPDERGTVYCIEEGKSLADKIYIDYAVCETVQELLTSRPFRVVYRRLLKKVYSKHPALADLSFAQVENQYGPHACLTAYRDRQLIDDVFRQLMRQMYEAWHGAGVVKVLASQLHATDHAEKVAALHGINRKINELINELMHAFEVPDSVVRPSGTMDVGFEILQSLKAHPNLPPYLRPMLERCAFAGVTTALNPSPMFITGAQSRVSDYRYGFIRRNAQEQTDESPLPPLSYFTRRLTLFCQQSDWNDYLCKAVQVGPFKLLLAIHKSTLHLVCDELRLFPQIPAVQLRANIDELSWDGVLLFGIPDMTLGESYKTGYVLDRKSDGTLMPVFWVAREDATDYVGFLKKSLLTMHNELVKSMGGMPVHGAMITITFKNGLRKTLVFSADSGTGKSETITAMMEQLISGTGAASEVRRVDILASDMLSLWRGEDRQIYAFGTETGDFLRTNDITESWKAHFGDLLKRGCYSNVDHPKNARVTIPGICVAQNVLSPTRVNGFFYINNYEPVRGRCVELSDDPHLILKQVLVRGLRKNKGTSGDQPSLRAGLEFSGKPDLVVRFRHTIDELVDWQPRPVQDKTLTCLVYRDGAADTVYNARELVSQAFEGMSFTRDGRKERIARVDLDILHNLFWLQCDSGLRIPLDRSVYDQIYEPLTSTFCGNPFVDPEGMDRTLGIFAQTMLETKVHRGIIRTQLARPGYEFVGPAKAAQDIIAFLLEDEEVNARFQRNKDKVHQAMQSTYWGVLEAGSNLPVELEGYNLLRLEAHESSHVQFLNLQESPFTVATPYYRYDPLKGTVGKTFSPAIALPEVLAVIQDICSNANYQTELRRFEVDLAHYDRITYWNSLEELTYQVLLVHGVIALGSLETEVARFPLEVRKAYHVARLLAKSRPPRMSAPLTTRPQQEMELRGNGGHGARAWGQSPRPMRFSSRR